MIALPSPSRYSIALREALLVLLALAPCYAVYLRHLTTPGATGFIQYDMPYYTANGREVFDRGGTLLHANPFDPDPAAPAIYFHWLTYLLGCGAARLGFDPAVQFLAVGVVAGWVGGWLTLKIVQHLAPDARDQGWLYLLVMWGGGLLAAGKLALNVTRGEPAFSALLSLDPAGGWWFLNWGRNFLLPTEAVYHALVAGAWLCILRRREWPAIGLIAALAATHPFSGLQHLLILGAWNLVQLVWGRERGAALARGLTITAVLVVFLGYYFVFLEQAPSHRALRQTWSLAWTLPLASVLLAYGPVGLAALAQWRRSPNKLSAETGFFATAFVVSFLLVKHDWFIRPHQPVHFTRGYVWTPLVLLALPYLASCLTRLRERLPAGRRTAVLAACGLLACSDNLAFYGLNATLGPPFQISQQLPAGARDVFRWMNDQRLRGVLLAPDEALSYLSAAYTGVRPYYGHRFNTPEIQRRWRELDAWSLKGQSGPWLDQIDYLLLGRQDRPQGFRRDEWRVLYENEGYQLFGR